MRLRTCTRTNPSNNIMPPPARTTLPRTLNSLLPRTHHPMHTAIKPRINLSTPPPHHHQHQHHQLQIGSPHLPSALPLMHPPSSIADGLQRPQQTGSRALRSCRSSRRKMGVLRLARGYPYSYFSSLALSPSLHSLRALSLGLWGEQHIIQ